MLRRLFEAFRKPADVKPLPELPKLEIGDLVSVNNDGKGNEYAVVKVLVLDHFGVHLKLYAQRFKVRPRPEDLGGLGELTTTPPVLRSGVPLAIEHLPFSHASFGVVEPQLIVRGAGVTEDELVGYRIWKEDGGGYL